MKKTISRTKVEASSLTEMVEYCQNAVVSKTLIDKMSGTVTLFAFDKDQGLSEHTTPYEAMVQILDGEALITISGKQYHLKAGEMIIMPANKPHSLMAPVKFKMLLTMMKA